MRMVSLHTALVRRRRRDSRVGLRGSALLPMGCRAPTPRSRHSTRQPGADNLFTPNAKEVVRKQVYPFTPVPMAFTPAHRLREPSWARRRQRRHPGRDAERCGRPPEANRSRMNTKWWQNAATLHQIAAEGSKTTPKRCRTEKNDTQILRNAAKRVQVNAERNKITPARCRTKQNGPQLMQNGAKRQQIANRCKAYIL